MLEHDALDLGGVGVESADDEHVLLAVGDREVAASVEQTDIAGVEPSVRVDGLGRRLGVVEVALHEVVAAHEHLAGLTGAHRPAVVVDDAHLDAGDGPSDRLGDGVGVVVVAAHGGDAGGLGEPVAGDDRLERQLLAHADDQLHGNARGAGHGQPQRRQVEAGPVGVVQHRLVDGRWPRQHRDVLLVHPAHHRGRVEHRVGQHGRAAQQ